MSKWAVGLNASQLRTLCADWPGVTEAIKWDVDLVLSVGGKMFVMTPADGGEGGRLSFKVSDDRFLELTDQPDMIPAPYLARAHWISIIEPTHFSTTDLEAFVRDAYDLVRAKLTKKVLMELSDDRDSVLTA